MSLHRWGHGLTATPGSVGTDGITFHASTVIAYGGNGRDVHKPVAAPSQRNNNTASQNSSIPPTPVDNAQPDVMVQGMGAEGKWLKKKDYNKLKKAQRRVSKDPNVELEHKQLPNERIVDGMAHINGRLGSSAIAPIDLTQWLGVNVGTGALVHETMREDYPQWRTVVSRIANADTANDVCASFSPPSREHGSCVTLSLPNLPHTLLSLLNISPYDTDSDSQSANADNLPASSPCSSSASASNSSWLCLYGGRQSPHKVLSDVWLQHVASGKWVRVAWLRDTETSPLVCVLLAATETQVYLCTDTVCLPVLYRHDAKELTTTVTIVDNSPLSSSPTTSSTPSIFAVGATYTLLDSCPHTLSSTSSSSSSSLAALLPAPRFRHATAQYGAALLVHGGRTVQRPPADSNDNGTDKNSNDSEMTDSTSASTLLLSASSLTSPLSLPSILSDTWVLQLAHYPYHWRRITPQPTDAAAAPTATHVASGVECATVLPVQGNHGDVPPAVLNNTHYSHRHHTDATTSTPSTTATTVAFTAPPPRHSHAACVALLPHSFLARMPHITVADPVARPTTDCTPLYEDLFPSLPPVSPHSSLSASMTSSAERLDPFLVVHGGLLSLYCCLLVPDSTVYAMHLPTGQWRCLHRAEAQRGIGYESWPSAHDDNRNSVSTSDDNCDEMAPPSVLYSHSLLPLPHCTAEAAIAQFQAARGNAATNTTTSATLAACVTLPAALSTASLLLLGGSSPHQRGYNTILALDIRKNAGDGNDKFGYLTVSEKSGYECLWRMPPVEVMRRGEYSCTPAVPVPVSAPASPSTPLSTSTGPVAYPATHPSWQSSSQYHWQSPLFRPSLGTALWVRHKPVVVAQCLDHATTATAAGDVANNVTDGMSDACSVATSDADDARVTRPRIVRSAVLVGGGGGLCFSFGTYYSPSFLLEIFTPIPTNDATTTSVATAAPSSSWCVRAWRLSRGEGSSSSNTHALWTVLTQGNDISNIMDIPLVHTATLHAKRAREGGVRCTRAGESGHDGALTASEGGSASKANKSLPNPTAPTVTVATTAPVTAIVAATTAGGAVAGTATHVCGVCQEGFSSKNQLYKHLLKWGHNLPTNTPTTTGTAAPVVASPEPSTSTV